MEHIKIFNSVAEKDNFIDADSFKYDIVGLIKNVEGVVYNPPQEVINSYTVSGITYDASVTFDSTANTVSWDYTLDKTTRSGKHVNTSGIDSQNVEYSVNTDSTNKNISGEIISYSEVIEYNFTQGIGTDKYFSFTALEDGTFTFSGYSNNTSIQYSVNNGASWVTLNSGVASPTVTSGNKILWRGTLTSYRDSDYKGVGNFTSTGRFNAQGNIMSLLYGDNFEGQTIVSEGGFSTLFKGNSNIVNSNGIILSITTAPAYCFYEMFRNCASLETAMEIKATTIGAKCCQFMFAGTKISKLPSLLATIASDGCYAYMFYGCDNITSIPANYLPATTLEDYCYHNMFDGCSSLISVPTDLLPATTLSIYCYQAMFYGCSSLTNVPNLPATNVVLGCYESMFKNCSSLTSVPANLLQATAVVERCYEDMFNGCSSLITTPNLPATSIRSWSYQGMFGGCTSLVNAPSVLPPTTMYENCYRAMFRNCTSLVTAPVLPATSIKSQCYQNMFDGCSSLNYIKAMFTTTPSTTSGNGPTGNWVKGVSSTGTFVKNSSASWSTVGDNGVPEGWTVETASS